MGKEIEKIALNRGHEIVLKINLANAGSITADDFKQADVAIEFSTPHSVIENLKRCFALILLAI